MMPSMTPKGVLSKGIFIVILLIGGWLLLRAYIVNPPERAEVLNEEEGEELVEDDFFAQ
jgi:regulator of protease activity HflC (stomatin/prohibitin superfamily)